MTTPSPRRNRIVPDPDEPSDLESDLDDEEEAAPFDSELEQDEWDEVGELASASGDDDADDEYETDDWEDEETDSLDDSAGEWDESEEEDEWEEELSEK